jgi:hypothetical protein
MTLIGIFLDNSGFLKVVKIVYSKSNQTPLGVALL